MLETQPVVVRGHRRAIDRSVDDRVRRVGAEQRHLGDRRISIERRNGDDLAQVTRIVALHQFPVNANISFRAKEFAFDGLARNAFGQARSLGINRQRVFAQGALQMEIARTERAAVLERQRERVGDVNRRVVAFIRYDEIRKRAVRDVPVRRHYGVAEARLRATHGMSRRAGQLRSRKPGCGEGTANHQQCDPAGMQADETPMIGGHADTLAAREVSRAVIVPQSRASRGNARRYRFDGMKSGSLR